MLTIIAFVFFDAAAPITTGIATAPSLHFAEPPLDIIDATGGLMTSLIDLLHAPQYMLHCRFSFIWRSRRPPRRPPGHRPRARWLPVIPMRCAIRRKSADVMHRGFAAQSAPQPSSPLAPPGPKEETLTRCPFDTGPSPLPFDIAAGCTHFTHGGDAGLPRVRELRPSTEP